MTYPKYYKSAAHDVKVISETLSVWVTKDFVQKIDSGMELFISDREYPESTETEFKKAYNKTSKYLKSLI